MILLVWLRQWMLCFKWKYYSGLVCVRWINCRHLFSVIFEGTDRVDIFRIVRDYYFEHVPRVIYLPPRSGTKGSGFLRLKYYVVCILFTGIPTTLDYHKLILEVQVIIGGRALCTEEVTSLPYCWHTTFCWKHFTFLPQLLPRLLFYQGSRFHDFVCGLQDFKDGKVDTAFIPKHEEELAAVSETSTFYF